MMDPETRDIRKPSVYARIVTQEQEHCINIVQPRELAGIARNKDLNNTPLFLL